MVSLPTGGLVASKPSVRASDISPTLKDVSHVVAPMSLLQVKGWTRSLALYAVMAACYEEEELLKARYWPLFQWDFSSFTVLSPGPGTKCDDAIPPAIFYVL